MTYETPCRVTAELRDHERKEDESDLRRERLEEACPDADLRLDILDSIFEPGDPWDWFGFSDSHRHQYALIMLAAAIARPDIRPRNWDDRNIVLIGMVHALLDDFVEARLPRARQLWIEEAERDGYLD